MKKIFSSLISAALAVSMSASAFAAVKFTDLDDDKYDWARKNIEAMAEKGYITGYDDGTFKPDNNITKLECIALFARAMGSGDKANEAILEEAHNTYDDLIKGYYLTWGQDEIVYMLYKGALTKSDLQTYIADKKKDQPMQRYEAAIIITKAMGGEDEAKKHTGVDLDYEDAKTIPSSAMQYVYYVTQQGIMTGMENNNFSPLSPVLRSQMATMLARVVNKTAYEYVSGKLTDIDTEAQTITVKNETGAEVEYDYDDNTAFKVQGTPTTIEDMPVNISVNVALSKGIALTVDATTSIPDEEVTGRYQGYQLVSSKTIIKLMPTGESKVKQYTCQDGFAVTYAGSPATMRSFSVDDLMTITLENGKVVAVSGQEKTQKISNAKVEKVNVGDELTITITHALDEYDGMTYPVADDVTVMKNGVPSDMAGLYPGDNIDMTLEYGEVTRITAMSSVKAQEGTIQSINISTESSMIVKIGGEEKEFIVPKDVKITINGEEATLYDFRVGDVVTITTESGAITKINSSGSSVTDGKISGVVTVVNTSYGFIKVMKEGSDTAETVYCRESSVSVITSKGVSKKLSDVKVGDTVETRCTISNGAYTAKLIIVEEQ